MEALLNQSRSLCPFLQRTSPATLRALSTPSRPHASPGGGTISNLQVIARRCPVMSKALAVQSARMATAKAFSTFAGAGPGGSNGVKGMRAAPGKKRFHTTASKAATFGQDSIRKHEDGEFFCFVFATHISFGFLPRGIIFRLLTLFN